MTKEDFQKIISKANDDCDGYEIHLKKLWEKGNAKSIFYITGLDFSNMFSNQRKELTEYNFKDIRP